MQRPFPIVVLFCLASPAHGQVTSAQTPPIIDMHLHAHRIPPGALECVGATFLPVDPGADTTSLPSASAGRWTVSHDLLHSCPDTLRAPETDRENLQATLAILERYNIRAVTSGALSMVLRWKAAAPDRSFRPSSAAYPCLYLPIRCEL